MSLLDIVENIKDALTGQAESDAPQNVDTSADPAFDGEQGIASSAQDPYGDPADHR